MSTAEVTPIVRYERRDVGEVLVPVSSLNTVFTDKTLKDRVSFALLWRVPTAQDKRGNLQALRKTSLVLRNDCASSLLLNVARPWGFLSDPLGVAAWEVLGGKDTDTVLKPGASANYHVEFYATPFVSPLRHYVEGSEYVHVVSFSVSYEVLSETGNRETLPAGVALTVVINTTYVAGGDSNSAHKAYIVRRYNTDVHMQTVNMAPVQPIALEQLRGVKDNIVSCIGVDCQTTITDKNVVGPVQLLFEDKNALPTHAPEGLDVTLDYVLSMPVPSMLKFDNDYSVESMRYDKMRNSLAYYIRYLKYRGTGGTSWYGPTGSVPIFTGQQGWYLFNKLVSYNTSTGRTDWNKVGRCGEAFFRPATSGEKLGSFTNGIPNLCHCIFKPVIPSTDVVVTATKRKAPRVKNYIFQRNHFLSSTEVSGDWTDTVVNAASFIVRVLRTAVLVAGALGLGTPALVDYECV